ncbi:MAG: hypothetical protein FJ125_14675 [Deltaproteobacteria bacterium]|nr:hypothetical protein [Deltaproteobacteria bacterium]
MGSVEAALAEYDELTSKIAAGLNDQQRGEFDVWRLQERARVDLEARRHVLKEKEQYTQDTYTAAVAGNAQNAMRHYRDPKQFQGYLRQAETLTKEQYQHEPPEKIDQRLLQLRTAVHLGAIAAMMDDDPQSAQVWFDRAYATGELDPSNAKVEQLKDALGRETIREKAQRLSDQIILSGGTLAEQKEAARENATGDLRDRVIEYLEHEHTKREQAKRDKVEADTLAAYNLLDRMGRRADVRAIPASIRETLPGPVRSALRAYAEQKAEGTSVPSFSDTYFELMEIASTMPDTFATVNLREFSHQVTKEEMGGFLRVQASIRAADTKAAAKDLAPFMSQTATLNNVLTQYGYDTGDSKNNPDREKVARIRSLMAVRIATAQAIKGNELTPTEVQAEAAALLAQQHETDGWFWSRPQARLVDIAIGDVPKTERAKIEVFLKAKGYPVTDQTVLERYIEMVMVLRQQAELAKRRK